MALVRSLVRGTDFRRFLDFVTPAFFDVMPARALLGMARRMVKDYRDESGRSAAIDHRQGRLCTEGIGPWVVREGAKPGARLGELNEAQRQRLGHAALELYFHQIFDPDGATLLNLGLDRFGMRDGEPVWSPGPGHIQWPEPFRAALEQVYRSFYLPGQPALEDALAPLGLSPTAHVFREHFGSGDQRAVRFQVTTFVESFHQVFLVCKREKIRLEPAFLALGIYLATLYETLEAVGVPLDVRGAFEAAAGRRAAA